MEVTEHCLFPEELSLLLARLVRLGKGEDKKPRVGYAGPGHAGWGYQQIVGSFLFVFLFLKSPMGLWACIRPLTPRSQLEGLSKALRSVSVGPGWG